MTFDDACMHRCLELAIRGAGYVAPNPLVGAILVHEDKIIGEGWHQRYGESHAEVNCIRKAFENGFGSLVPRSTLYVSLEPCAHYGKTPPCADHIISKKIPRVVIGCLDPFPEVNGNGVAKLQAAGIETIVGVLELKCRDANKRFFTFHTRKRPFVILKWAQTPGGIIGTRESRLLISNEMTSRLVHRWRSEEAAILVGTNTVLEDDPELTARYWPGPSPLRLVIDLELKIPQHSKIFNDNAPTLVFNGLRHSEGIEGTTVQHLKGISYYKLNRQGSIVRDLLDALYQLRVQSVIIEGGAKLLQSFIDEGTWDEARIIEGGYEPESISNAVMAPSFNKGKIVKEYRIASDKIQHLEP